MPLGSWYSQLPVFGWFDPEDRPGSAAYRVGGRSVPDSQQGIALPTRGGLGKWYNVTPPGSDRPYPLQQTDIGPAKWTGRGVDISAAGAHQMGYTPKNFPTDANFKVEPIDTTGLGLAAGYMGGVPGQNDTAVAEGPTQGRKMPAASLYDMMTGKAPLDWTPRDAAGESSDFASNLQGRSNSLIGLGLGLLQPSNPLRGQSSWGNALEGFQAGAGLDARTAQAAALLKERRAERAQAQANLQITDAQRAMRDVLGDKATPEAKAEFMKNYYASKTDPGGWILKDIIDPSDPDGERKITVQEHNRTGQIRPPQLPGQTSVGSAAAPATNWSGANAPVYGQGGNYTPGAGAAAAPVSRRNQPIAGATGITYQPPAGLSKEGRKAWENHVAATEAKIAGGEITMDQANASMYGGQMRIAEDLVRGIEKQGLDVPGKAKEKAPWGVGNLFQTPEYQKYQSGKDAFINSKLRRQSGATIRDDEYYREEKIYFPQPGDDEDRINYKRALREDAIKRMEQAAGPSYTRPPAAPQPTDKTKATPTPNAATGGKPGGGAALMKFIRDAAGNIVPAP